MDQSRSNTISEWSAAEDTLGPIPDLNNEEILKDLARCFTSKDNPVGTSRPNVQFQRYLTTTIRADNAYYSNPTLGRLCEMVASIMHRWERHQPHGWTRHQRIHSHRQQVEERCCYSYGEY